MISFLDVVVVAQLAPSTTPATTATTKRLYTRQQREKMVPHHRGRAAHTKKRHQRPNFSTQEVNGFSKPHFQQHVEEEARDSSKTSIMENVLCLDYCLISITTFYSRNKIAINMKLSPLVLFGVTYSSASLVNGNSNNTAVQTCSYTDTCSVNGIDGICVSKSSGCCTGALTSGYCPGSSDVQCCTSNSCSTPQVGDFCEEDN